MQPSFPGVPAHPSSHPGRRRARGVLKRVGTGLGAVALVLGATGSVGNAIANGETRTLEIYHTHTKESAAITYKRGGQFDKAGLDKLNWILRDWRRDEPTNMDPRLFDIAWEVRKEVGSSEPLNIVSAYRAPETNAMLRHRSRAVAKNSQHMQGKAMDFFLPDVSMANVREIALRLQAGGVGYYPTSFNPFVHLDAGSVRMWPRMTRDQLTRLFPDGKTVLIPADGKPMPRFDDAYAEIEARGGSVSAYASAGDEDRPGFFSTKGGKSFFAALFGSGEDDDAELANARGRRVASKPAPRTTAVAAYAPAADDGRMVRDTSLGAIASQPTRRFDQQVVRPTPQPEEIEAPAVAAAPAPPPTPAAPVVADVPLPIQRPAALASLQPPAPPAMPAGPQLVWQQGPDSTANGAEPVAYAKVPLPLARPGDLAPILGPGFANVPLPPARPIQVASVNGMVPASYAPLVPAAPALPPVLSGNAVVAPPGVPPRAVVTGRPTAHQDDAVLTAGTFDKSGLNALFATAVLAPAAKGQASVTTARTKAAERELTGVTAKPATTLAVGFSDRPFDDLHADHFTGPAVKAVPVAAFAKR